MKKNIFVSILLLVTFLFAVNGFAQQQQPKQQPQQRPQGQPDQKQQQAAQSGEQLHWAQKSSDILDKKIISRDGKELGTAKDLIIGKDGNIEYVILSKGGLLGIGGEQVAVPWDKVKTTPNVDQLMADVSESEIQKYTEGQKESGEKGSRRAGRGDKESQMPLAQVDPAQTRELMGQKLVGANGEELGQVADLFTTQEGKPVYVVVEDASQKMRPVPAQLVRTNPQDKSLTADFDKQAFMSSPSFDEAQLSEQQQWEPQVSAYYQSISQGGQQPGQSPPSGMNQGGQQPPSRTGQPGQQPPPGAGQQPPQGMGQSGQPRSQ